MKETSMKVRDMCYIAIFTAVIAIMAQIAVPLAGGVPVTLQTFAVVVAAIVLGGKRGAFSCLIYLLVGAVGVPVFSGLRGGLGVIFGPTGGFIISYPIMALCIGYAAGKAEETKNKGYGLIILVISLAAATVIDYILGMVWYSLMTGNGMAAAFAACVAPFIINDIIKLVLGGWLGTVLRKRLKRINLL